MSVPRIVGLDLSSTRVGMCRHDGTTDHFVAQGPLLTRAVQIRDWITTECRQADLVVIEAIATQQVQTAIAMGYCHCLVDLRLFTSHVRTVKVAPSVLKKWLTGRGNADKTAMVLAAQKHGWEPNADSTDDEADAWAAWSWGRQLLDVPVLEMTQFRRDAMAKAAA